MMVIGSVAGFIFAVGSIILIRKIKQGKRRRRARSEADRIISKAKSEGRRIESQAKKESERLKRNIEKELKSQRSHLDVQHRQLKNQESEMERSYKNKEEDLIKRENSLKSQAQKTRIAEERLQSIEQNLEKQQKEFTEKLEKSSHYTVDQAKEELINQIKKQAKYDAAKEIIEVEKNAKDNAERKAKRIISLAISRYAGEYVNERTVTQIETPGDEAKGKIIGKEGRNIRALEAACGVDLIVDETPEMVIISGFDPVRREVAKLSIEKLLDDGRIHPTRIQEVVHKTKSDLFKKIKQDGEKACYELGINGVDNEILKLIGSLRYRMSYLQNNYFHSIEVGHLCGLMAAELGEDIKVARRAGLMHDIGKALDHSIEGSHAVIGADFAKSHGESEAVCHAIRSHHDDEKPRTVIAHLTSAADALSGARPGARRQVMESYVKRLEDLESIGNSFDGVIRTFALQAGREVRILVEGAKVTDEQSLMLSRDIARKIEKEMNYPGQIKVTVIRETRAIDFAR